MHGPIARELANGDHPDVIEMQQLQLGGGAGGPEVWGGDFGLMLDPQQQKRKREQQLQTDQDKAVSEMPWSLVWVSRMVGLMVGLLCRVVATWADVGPAAEAQAQAAAADGLRQSGECGFCYRL